MNLTRLAVLHAVLFGLGLVVRHSGNAGNYLLVAAGVCIVNCVAVIPAGGAPTGAVLLSVPTLALLLSVLRGGVQSERYGSEVAIPRLGFAFAASSWAALVVDWTANAG